MNRVPPARGLRFLTWAQVEQIDARLASLAAYAQASGCGVQMFLQVNERGLLTSCGEPMVVHKVKPGR